MNHRPFEDWLLTDQPLTAEQRHELQNHLRICAACSAIAEVNLALRKAKTAVPAAGFSRRWQTRLAAERQIQRRKQIAGMTLLVTISVVVLIAIGLPLLMLALTISPAEWIVDWLGYLFFLTTSIETFGEAVRIIVQLIPNFIPAYVWLAIFSALAGSSLLGTLSLRRVTSLHQKA